MFGPLDKPENKTVRDVHGRETWVFGIMVVAALVMGIAPQPILSRSEKSVNAFITGYRDRLQDARRSPETLRTSIRRCRPRRRRPRRRRRRPRPLPRRPRRRSARRCRAVNFDSSQILAFTPLLILIGMGCVVLLAETFVRGQSRAGLAWLAVAGCVVALVAVVMQWPDAAEAKTYFDADADRRSDVAVPRRRVHRRGAADAAVRAAVPARAGLRVRRVLRAGAVRGRRHGDGGARDAPGVAADRHRDDVAGRLRADRLLAQEPSQLRRRR